MNVLKLHNLVRALPRSMTRVWRSSFSTDTNPEMSDFVGAPGPFTRELSFRDSFGVFPCYRVLAKDGSVLSTPAEVPSDDKLVQIYKTMVKLNVLDGIFYDAQRQGRIPFYMTHFGEEVAVVASAAALDARDEVFAQYREAGVLMWRGFALTDFAHQCCSNAQDLGKGRQMPIHYGSRALHFQTISSPLGTQIPQAVGAAYAIKRSREDRIVIVYFGDGAASEGDAHAGLNMASTLDAPMIFFCRNNGWAISTPTREQYRGDGIAVRGPAYGINTLRVDGTDVLAVYSAVKEARRIALEQQRPVLIESMGYRAGHHSTSDDSTRYRSKEEIIDWMTKKCPVNRTRVFLEKKGLWDIEQETEFRQESRQEVLDILTEAEKVKKAPISQLFQDVYDKLPLHHVEQQEELLEHLAKYGEHYHLEQTYVKDDRYVDPAIAARQ